MISIFSIFSIVFDYFKSFYYFNRFNNNTNNINKNMNLNNQIENFLKELHEDWKNKNIKNIDMTYDILNLFIKYKNLDTNLIYNENNENKDMKYYTLGWYIHQCIENK
jgi:hypothetical protein